MCLYGRPRPGGARVQARRRGGMAGVACCTVSRRAWPRARARGAMALPRGRSSPQADEDGEQRSLSSKNMHSSCLSRCWCPECGDWLEDVEMQTKIALECWQCDKDARAGRLRWRCHFLLVCSLCALNRGSAPAGPTEVLRGRWGACTVSADILLPAEFSCVWISVRGHGNVPTHRGTVK